MTFRSCSGKRLSRARVTWSESARSHASLLMSYQGPCRQLSIAYFTRTASIERSGSHRRPYRAIASRERSAGNLGGGVSLGRDDSRDARRHLV